MTEVPNQEAAEKLASLVLPDSVTNEHFVQLCHALHHALEYLHFEIAVPDDYANSLMFPSVPPEQVN